MSSIIIIKEKYTYHFTCYENITNCMDISLWLEKYNPIYAKIPNKIFVNFTGKIKVLLNNLVKYEIKIFEGNIFKIYDCVELLLTYIQNDKIPLEIRINKNINKINVLYIYDNYKIIKKINDLNDINYQDMMEINSFYVKNAKISELSINQLNIFKKFENIIKETIQQINHLVDNIEN